MTPFSLGQRWRLRANRAFEATITQLLLCSRNLGDTEAWGITPERYPGPGYLYPYPADDARRCDVLVRVADWEIFATPVDNHY